MPRRHTIPHSQERIKRKRKRALLNTLLIAVACSALILVSAWILSVPRFRIAHIEVSGNSVVLENELIARAKKDLDGKYFFLFPHDSVFLYPGKTIKNDILNDFTRIVSVNVSLKGLTTLSITVTEYKPYSLWCGSENVGGEKKDSSCYFMDENGFLFALAPQFSDNVYTKFYGPLASNTPSTGHSTPPPLRATFLSVGEFKKLNLFQSLLGGIGVTVHKAVAMGSRDFDFGMDEGGTILWNLRQDPVKLASDFESAFRTELGDPRDVRLRKKIEYIDLRFDNKVFFKKRETP